MFCLQSAGLEVRMNAKALGVLSGVALLALANGGFDGLLFVIALILASWVVRSACIGAAGAAERRRQAEKQREVERRRNEAQQREAQRKVERERQAERRQGKPNKSARLRDSVSGNESRLRSKPKKAIGGLFSKSRAMPVGMKFVELTDERYGDVILIG